MGEIIYLRQSAIAIAEKEMKINDAYTGNLITYSEAMHEAGKDLQYRVEVLEKVIEGKLSPDHTAMVCIRDMARIAVYLQHLDEV
ncbi:MAG: hypothetical protein ABW072_17290 [Sedimenticola sp.]